MPIPMSSKANASKRPHMINISTDEGMLKLNTYLRKVGVDAELRAMGAQDGDTVVLVDFEFEYIS